MRDYSVGRGLCSFIEVMSWIGVVLGVIIAFSAAAAANRGFGGGMELVAAMPGLAYALISLIGVALTQMARASIDSAEYGQQSLKVARDQLEVSRQALKQDKRAQQSFADLAQRLQELRETQAMAAETPPPTGQAKASYADAKPTLAADADVPSAPADTPEEPIITGDMLSYAGHNANLVEGKWHLNGIAFNSQERLVEYIDTFGKKANPKPLSAER